MADRRVIVVGTTGDYIEKLLAQFKNRVFFITDQNERSKWSGPSPGRFIELVCDFGRPFNVLEKTLYHLAKIQMEPTGITCFDCESLQLTAFLARFLRLPFATEKSVVLSRSKYLSYKVWTEAGINCPDSFLISTADEAVSIFDQLDNPIVIKPQTGTGSELVFFCKDSFQCKEAIDTMVERLAHPRNPHLYTVYPEDNIDPIGTFIAQTFIEGFEYSCDFILRDNRIEIIRIAQKISANRQSFGTTLAYIIPALFLSKEIRKILPDILLNATRAIGFERTIVMADFIVKNEEVILLEMSPRLGGDCIPDLISYSGGVNIFELALDFAEGGTLLDFQQLEWTPMIALRIIANEQGRIKFIDSEAVLKDPRVVDLVLYKGPGHQVVLPPFDYDSRMLGHIIYQLENKSSIESQCITIAEKFIVEME